MNEDDEQNVNPFASVLSSVAGARPAPESRPERKSRLMPKSEVSEKRIGNMADISLLLQDELLALKIIHPGMSQRGLLIRFLQLKDEFEKKTAGKNFVLLVSSVCPKGGASFFAINIAAAIAMDEDKTALYIDCNFSNPFSLRLLKDKPEVGLIEYLEDSEMSVEEIIYASGINRLRVIPPGRGGDVSIEHLASERMRELIAHLRKRFGDRSIVMDLPSVSVSSVARILSGVSDMSVLIVPSGKVTPDEIATGVDVLGEENFAGLIFNYID